MGEEVNLKEVTDRLLDIMLQLTVEQQNEVWTVFRQSMIAYRRKMIDEKNAEIKANNANVEMICRTTEDLFVGSFQPEPVKATERFR